MSDFIVAVNHLRKFWLPHLSSNFRSNLASLWFPANRLLALSVVEKDNYIVATATATAADLSLCIFNENKLICKLPPLCYLLGAMWLGCELWLRSAKARTIDNNFYRQVWDFGVVMAMAAFGSKLCLIR